MMVDIYSFGYFLTRWPANERGIGWSTKAQINLTKTATFVTAESKGGRAVLGEFPWEKTGNLAGQGFLQGMAGISKESADLSKSPPPQPKPL